MQCVVFDMDGVLFDSEKLVLQCWEQTAQAHHIPDIQTACRSCLGSNAASARQKFLEKYGADFPYDTYKQEMSARYWQQVETGKLELKPGVREMLQFLREQHIPAAIASSTRRAAVRQQITLFGLQDFFCKIIGGEIPSNKVYEDELCYAFYDIAPQAPTHFLVVPKAHIQSVTAITPENSAVVAHIFEVIAKLAQELGFAEAGYRVVSNIGEAGQQSVPHLHFHVLAGRDMTWPPG